MRQSNRLELYGWLVRLHAGLLLVVAACLKVAGLRVSLGGEGLRSLTALLVAGECLLGLWLVSNRLRAIAWAVAVVLFGGFAAITSHSAWVGRASCGCFGVVEVDPKWALLVDLIVLVGLLATRPRWDELTEQVKRSGPALAAWVGGPVILAALVFGVALWRFPSLEAAVAWLRGEPLYAAPGGVDLGSGQPGESKTANVTVANWTDRPIRLIGGTSDCSCTVLGELPMTIPAQSQRAVPVTVQYPGGSGAFTRSLSLRTDCDQMRVVRFEITGVVRREEVAEE